MLKAIFEDIIRARDTAKKLHKHLWSANEKDVNADGDPRQVSVYLDLSSLQNENETRNNSSLQLDVSDQGRVNNAL